MSEPLQTFIIYARADEDYKNDLLRHLRGTLIASGDLRVWSDDQIRPGEEWDKAIKTNLENSGLVLVLVSADSLASDYINSNELRQAVTQRAEGRTVVVPIVVKPCGWRFNPIIRELQGLPKDMRPISGYADRETAWMEVLDGLEIIINNFRRRGTDREAAAFQTQAETAETERRTREATERELLKQLSEKERRRDHAAFAVAKTVDTPTAYQDYLRDFPTGLHKRDAKNLLQAAIFRENPAKQKAAWATLRNFGIGILLFTLGFVGINYSLGTWAAKPDAADSPAKPKFGIPAGTPDDGMVFIKGGTFQMGCTGEQQDCGDDEKPVHQVSVPDFYLGKYEVTQKLWQALMGSNPAHFANCDDCPVENVSWDDVQVFLQKLNARYPGRNYRLPSEAEWEYAAREGGKAVLFGNGKNVADPEEINFNSSPGGRVSLEWSYAIQGQYRQKTTPVGSFAANTLGLYDMSGNVWEWCEDWYHDSYAGAPVDGVAWLSPAGSRRLCRGGSWGNFPQNCRSAVRFNGAPGDRYTGLGFRLAKTF